MKALLGIVCAVALSGCGDSVERDEALLMWAAKTNRIGSSADYVLMKATAFGPARVGLIFGVIDDWELCQEIAEMYNQRYSEANLYCQAAN